MTIQTITTQAQTNAQIITSICEDDYTGLSVTFGIDEFSGFIYWGFFNTITSKVIVDVEVSTCGTMYLTKGDDIVDGEEAIKELTSLCNTSQEDLYDILSHHFMYCEEDSWESNTDLEEMSYEDMLKYYVQNIEGA